jgi:oligopeptide/dipeptide ABC transporter ATP-binding protein
VSEAPLLEIDDLHTSFETSNGLVRAVDGLSLHIGRGEIVAVVGESGCGKSVAMRSILRLLPKRRARLGPGRILLDGRNLLDLSEAEVEEIRGRDIAMIFQDPMASLNPVLTIGRQIGETIARHRGGTRQQIRERTIELLHQVGLPAPESRVDAYPHEFSGGMRQRVMIAMALSCDPRLILADEPTTALDVTIQAQILRLLKDVVAETGAAVILVTHDMGLVAGAAERVYVMYAGVVVEAALVNDIFHRPMMPYTWGLLRSIPRLDRSVDEPLEPIEGVPPDASRIGVGCRFRARCGYSRAICAEKEPPLAAMPDREEHAARCWGTQDVPSGGWLIGCDWRRDYGDPATLEEIRLSAARALAPA